MGAIGGLNRGMTGTNLHFKRIILKVPSLIILIMLKVHFKSTLWLLSLNNTIGVTRTGAGMTVKKLLQ